MSQLPPAIGELPPLIHASGPGGEASRALVDLLAAVECPGLTARRRRRAELTGASHDPIIWARAQGVNVVDVDGNRYVDMTGGFGVALLGHGHPEVVAAVQAQAGVMMHALGDVHPSAQKIELESRLAAMVPWSARVILGLSGADAIEAALKSAMLATKRGGVLAFEGSYHGLSYGALAACGYKFAFREPFAAQLNPAVRFAPYPAAGDVDRALAQVRAVLAAGHTGAVLIEPTLGRGGVEAAAPGALAAIGGLAREHGALLIVDEIYTGLGRTGPWLQSLAMGADPDVVVVGKALGGGLPVSAAIVREEAAAAWGASVGEAIHTSTFLGNPLACAAALASLGVLARPETVAMIDRCGAMLEQALRSRLQPTALGVRRLSFARMLVGVAIEGGLVRALGVCRRLLERGYIVLTGGVAGDVLTLTPPASLTGEQVAAFATTLAEVLAEVQAA
ncbi:MAG: Gamma-aminobutyrate alpha-ketoglutarate aminotransferase [Myxococcaceae bacterium]|nr:Gamma-aminobutyrate alpha-ketoglutarate aminotransferase [Myxococcaceae bacterium]